MERLKQIKESLVSCIQSQITHLDSVDTEELGDVIDMVKDLEEAIYYCTITKAMEEGDKEERSKYFLDYKYPYKDDYTMYPYREERDLDRGLGRMYYNGNESNSKGRSSNSQSEGNNSYDKVLEWPSEMRDRREGKSWRSRKSYIESKEMHHEKSEQMKELEKYMQELSSDIIEMIEEATPEEKQFLSSKISTLASKISSGK